MVSNPMADTLILYEGRYGHSQRAAEIVNATVLKESACFPADEAAESLDDVKNILLVVGFLAYDTAKKLKPYLERNQEELKDKTIGMVGVGLAQQALPAFVKIIEKSMNRNVDGSWFAMGGYQVEDLTPQDRKMLEEFWAKQGLPLKDQEYFEESQIMEIAEQIAVLFDK